MTPPGRPSDAPAPRRSWSRAHPLPLAWVLAIAAATFAPVVHPRAERPPMRRYESADGLAHDRVKAILPDTRGFVWLATAAGLNRFDGVRFVTYTAADGLGVDSVNTILQIGEEGYLVGTNGGGIGWYRADAPTAAQPRFRAFTVDEPIAATNRVNVLARDGAGRLWAGTDGGLFQVHRGDDTFTLVRVDLGSEDDARVQVFALAADAEDRLWIGTSAGLMRREADGRVAHDAIRPAQGADIVRTLLVDRERGVWVGHDAGLFLIGLAGDFPDIGRRDGTGTFGDRLRIASADGLPDDRVYALHRGADGVLWIGTGRGLSWLADDRLTAVGLTEQGVRALAEDAQGDLWIATLSSGVARLAARGLTTYGTDDGLAHPNVRALFETRDGRLAVVTRDRALSIFDGTRFHAIRPKFPDGVTSAGRGWHVPFLEDSRGDWWVPSGDGLFRFTGVRRPEDLANRAPSAFYTERDGLAGVDIWRLFEDSHGDVWIATRVPGQEVLTRWDRATNRFIRYGQAQGLAPYNAVAGFGEDASGQVWLGLWDGGAARLRSGRFEMVPSIRDLVEGWYQSADGTLWAASRRRGLLRIDGAGTATPLVTVVDEPGRARGRSLVTVTADRFGRVYAGGAGGGGEGVVRFDPATGTWRQFSVDDGLAHHEVTASLRDRTGALWFGTNAGVSRLVPQATDPRTPVRLLIGGAQTNGVAMALPDLGTAAAGPYVFGAGQRSVEIEYLVLGGQAPRLEYRLEGAEREWTLAAGRRSVNYASLSSGAYRFVVRAPDGDRWVEASMTFSIRPPIWRRAWFVVSVIAVAGLLLIGAHRARVARLLAIERVRTRIAGDLHDDIGSNLSQIAILGELLQRPARSADGAASLARIADLSRESVDALGDIVWSIDPDKDRLGNLVTRMRRLANDLLSAHDVSFTFDVRGTAEMPIGAETRRDVFLAFKETLHNVVRHARSRTVAIDVWLAGGQLGFRVQDAGAGFDTAHTTGHGLSSLKRRAARLGGRLSVTSAVGEGTLVELIVPAVPSPPRRT